MRFTPADAAEFLGETEDAVRRQAAAEFRGIDVATAEPAPAVAVPHPGRPVISPAARPAVRPIFLAEPLDAAGPDGRPIDTLFLVVGPGRRVWLELLGQLAGALHDDGLFRARLLGRVPARCLSAGVRRASARMSPERLRLGSITDGCHWRLVRQWGCRATPGTGGRAASGTPRSPYPSVWQLREAAAAGEAAIPARCGDPPAALRDSSPR